MAKSKDWQAWHEAYAEENTPLSRRLQLVQRHIASWLDERKGEKLTVVSACAGQGHDLLGVLATRTDAHRVSCTLLEYDQRNVAAACAVVSSAAPAQRQGRSGRRRRPLRVHRVSPGRPGAAGWSFRQHQR